MVAMQDEYQRNPAAGAVRQAHRKAARPPADRQLTRYGTTAITCHAVLRHFNGEVYRLARQSLVVTNVRY
jgi:hypothetical protein